MFAKEVKWSASKSRYLYIFSLLDTYFINLIFSLKQKFRKCLKGRNFAFRWLVGWLVSLLYIQLLAVG